MLGSFNLLPFNRGTSKECFVNDALLLNVIESNNILNMAVSDSISIDFIEELNSINKIVSENLLIVASEIVNNFSKKAIDSLLIVSIESFSDRQFNTIDYIITNTLESLNLLGNLPVINDSLIISINTTFIEIANGISVVDDLIIDIFDESVEKLEGADLVENAPILLEESQTLLVTTSGLDPPIIALEEVASIFYKITVSDNLQVILDESNGSKEYLVADNLVIILNDNNSNNRILSVSDILTPSITNSYSDFIRVLFDNLNIYIDDTINLLNANISITDPIKIKLDSLIDNFDKTVIDSLITLLYANLETETQIYVKVNGVWKNVTIMQVKVDNELKTIFKVYNKVSGAWELR